MREILFRGKRTDNGEWVQGYFCKKYFQELPHDRYVVQYKTEHDAKKWQPDYMAAEVIPETVGQYTGLTDKNGKKIFEGDIVAGALYWIERKKNGIVTFRDGSFGLLWYRGEVEQFNAFTSMCNVKYEVIGNIHDTPELLKGENDA